VLRKTLKSLLSGLSAMVVLLRLIPAIVALEKVCAYLVGKGASSDYHSSGEIEALKAVLPADAIIFDVGANNGEWAALLAASLNNPSFYLFGCAPICLLEMKRRLPRIPNPHVFEFAISDEIGEIAFYTPTRGSGLSSIHSRRDVGVNQEVYEKIVVPRRTLDSVIAEQQIERVDLLKMDIEGHELSALIGAKNSIAEGRIEKIMFEFGSANVNSRTFFRDFWDLLELRFDLFRITPCGHLCRLGSYAEDLEYFRGSTNYLGILRR
jgi:FkbM family methyltransferase